MVFAVILYKLVDLWTDWLAIWNLWSYNSSHPRNAKKLSELEFQGWVFMKSKRLWFGGRLPHLLGMVEQCLVTTVFLGVHEYVLASSKSELKIEFQVKENVSMWESNILMVMLAQW